MFVGIEFGSGSNASGGSRVWEGNESRRCRDLGSSTRAKGDGRESCGSSGDAMLARKQRLVPPGPAGGRAGGGVESGVQEK